MWRKLLAYGLLISSLHLGFVQQSYAIDCKRAALKFGRKKPKVSRTRLAVSSIVLASLGLFGPHLAYDLVALSKGYSHIGSGIFFDGNEILQREFSEADRKRLLSPDISDSLKVELLALRIAGSYDSDLVTNGNFGPHYTLASDYFDSDNPKRGICRDKCLVLASMLHYLNIDAEIETASGSDTQPNGHVWIYLPKLEKIIDPTMAEFRYRLQDPEKYRESLSDLGFVLNRRTPLSDLIQYIKSGYQR